MNVQEINNLSGEITETMSQAQPTDVYQLMLSPREKIIDSFIRSSGSNDEMMSSRSSTFGIGPETETVTDPPTGDPPTGSARGDYGGSLREPKQASHMTSHMTYMTSQTVSKHGNKVGNKVGNHANNVGMDIQKPHTRFNTNPYRHFAGIQHAETHAYNNQSGVHIHTRGRMASKASTPSTAASRPRYGILYII
jgi:hypothetical protein